MLKFRKVKDLREPLRPQSRNLPRNARGNIGLTARMTDKWQEPGSDNRASARAFIAANLPVRPAPGLPEILIHTATPQSGLRRLAAGRNPYWAWCWAGGLALARHVLAYPETVTGLRVLDLGSGSGLIAIAAGKVGAAHVLAVDNDPDAVAAAEANAAANGVTIAALCADVLDTEPPDVDVVLVGDLFYDRSVARRVTGFLERCAECGARFWRQRRRRGQGAGVPVLLSRRLRSSQ